MNSSNRAIRTIQGSKPSRIHQTNSSSVTGNTGHPNNSVSAKDDDQTGNGSRKTFDKSSYDDSKSDSCTEQQATSSKDNAQRRALLKSRNPYADINNPNNPNYKGRPGNRDIENYLAQRNILRERELQRKQGIVGENSSEDHDSESSSAMSYDSD